MSTIERIDQLIEIAQQLGYRIRHDYFGGTGGGKCEFGGQKWLFIDLALTSVEQLDQLQAALADEPLLQTVNGPAQQQGKNMTAELPVNRAALMAVSFVSLPRQLMHMTFNEWLRSIVVPTAQKLVPTAEDSPVPIEASAEPSSQRLQILGSTTVSRLISFTLFSASHWLAASTA